MTAAPSAAEAVREAIRRVEFGPIASFANLSVVPLLDATEEDAGYLTLDEALATGAARVTEVSEEGQVSRLAVDVTGDRPVLLLDGEELVGAKQNRVANLTILLPSGRRTVVPVSCVEAGRWERRSREFATSPRTQFAEGRKARVQQVTESILRTGERRSDQSAVWDLIADKSARMRTRSATSAMSDVFDRHAASIEDFVAAFPPVARQVGAVFCIDGEPVGLERFDSAATWRKLSGKVVRGYALDALDRGGRAVRGGDLASSRAFATRVAEAGSRAFPGVGVGEDVRMNGGAAAGAALVVDGCVVHLSAFPGEV
jgi:hypothetical protein